MIQDLILFFQNGFWFFSFLSLPYFYFFIKIIITSLRGKNLLRVRSPQFPSPLTPFLLGHGLRRCLKNLPASEVSSVSNEQIRVALFFFQNSFWSFLSHHVIPNSIRDLIFFQKVFDFSFITLCHPERCASSYALASKNDSGSHFYFFKIVFDSFFYHFFVFIFS